VSALPSSRVSESTTPNRLTRAWRSDSIALDIVVVSVVLCVVFLFSLRNWFGAGDALRAVKPQLYSLEAQILASVLGLLIAGAAIIAGSSSLDRLKVGSYRLYAALAKSLRDSMYCAAFSLGAALFCWIFDASNKRLGLVPVLLALFVLVLLRVVRTIRRLYQTMLV
jgi:hypothetical protein